jgi:hypothetical protein
LAFEVNDLKGFGLDLALTGFSDVELAALSMAPRQGLTDPDDVPETPFIPISMPGDVWILNNDRLICGDCSPSSSTRP